MVSKKNETFQQPVVSTLVVPKTRVEKLLREQITASTQLLSIQVPYKHDVRGYNSALKEYNQDAESHFFNEYKKWNSRNIEIFTRIFKDCNNKDLAGYKSSGMYYAVSNIVEEQKNAISKQVAYMEGFIDRLDLIPCTFEENKESINIYEVQDKKPPMVFISHSSKDKLFVDFLVDLLEFVGLSDKNLFCSSVDGYGIKLSGDIFSTLRNLFVEYELFVIFVHSPRYYESPVCLNEMGAAWALKNDFCSILTSDMKFSDMKGVVNSSSISIKVDDESASSRLNELKDNLISFIGLDQLDQTKWERKRNRFIEQVK